MRRDKVKVFRVSRGAFLSIFRAGIPSGRMGLRDFPPLPAPGFRGYDHGKVRGSGYSWALTVASFSVRFLGFGYGFLARMAGKTPGGRSCADSRNTQRVSYWPDGRKGEPPPAGKATSADELRAPPGVAVARATYGRSCSANQPAPTLSLKTAPKGRELRSSAGADSKKVQPPPQKKFGPQRPGAARHPKIGACFAKPAGGNSSFKKQSQATRLGNTSVSTHR